MVAMAVRLALLVFGCVGAVLGKAPVGRSCSRVLIGGWLAMSVTFGLTKLVGSTGLPTVKTSSDMPCHFSIPQRAASLNRFCKKKKDRCFDKKIRYAVRKEVALRHSRSMQLLRIHGFLSLRLTVKAVRWFIKKPNYFR